MYEISLLNTCMDSSFEIRMNATFVSNKELAMMWGYISFILIYLRAEFVTYSTELLALISHLLPYRPALCSQAVPEVDGVDG